MNPGVPPLAIKDLTESKPLKCRSLVPESELHNLFFDDRAYVLTGLCFDISILVAYVLCIVKTLSSKCSYLLTSQRSDRSL